MAALVDSETEWLEADGLGGFASGTTCGIATRRYHALLLVSARPPSERFVLVNGFTAWLETAEGALQLTRHHYAPGVTTEAQASIESFESEPWPTVRYRTRSGLTLSQEILVERGRPLVVLRFHLETPTKGVTLCIRPLLSGRDFHSTHHENAAFRFEPGTDRGLCVWAPYPGVPAIRSWSNGEYRHAPDWYRRFRYAEEQRRGLDCDEDLAAPGVLRFDLGRSDALWLLSASTPGALELSADGAAAYCRDLLERERARRAAYPSALERAADAYVVARGDGRSVIAGYPWFSDWGRDTFIALRGLCLATGRLEAARSILVNWSGLVSEGMLPNRFLEHGSEPEYNSVDASLWYVIAASELLRHPRATGVVSLADARGLRAAISEIISGYVRGTRFGIRCDADGLLSAGEPGSQLTWMDAKVGDHVVTPRSGKPVEIQALWLNALHCAAELSPEFPRLLARARQSFEVRFWNAELGALYDVIDVNHRPGDVDPTIRPNQIFAAGGLPSTMLSEERARRVVDLVERQLWTPLGLRSLSPQHAHYAPQYRGGVRERDVAYHQGTVWPWLMGPFVEAWVRSRGGTPEAKSEARRRFLLPLREHLSHAGIGHVSEIADAEPPHAPRGCPFQAWSLAELLRLELQLRE